VPILLGFLTSKLAKQIATVVLLEIVAALAAQPKGKR
jgi:hypothetical protein